MIGREVLQVRSPLRHPPRKSGLGFSLIELVTVVAIGMIATAMAVPLILSSLQYYQLSSAATSITGTIQATRYRAIFDGCPYQLSFSKASGTYQVSSEVTGSGCATGFTNTGGAVYFAKPSKVVLSQDTALQFSPGGTVQVVTGSLNFSLSYAGSSMAKNITVTKYGSVKVQ
jgi:Tfp pilus assembly protein FimT